MQQLLQREKQGGRRDAEQQAQFDRIIYDFQLRDLQAALDVKDRARAMEIIETIDRMPAAQRNARHATQVGWVYLEFGQDEAAIARFEAGLDWEPDIDLAEDLRRGLALAYYHLSQRDGPEAARLRLRRLDAAEAALARVDPDDARNRELLGEIFLVRAGDAFESKEYGQSLAYLDQAESLGRRGRDVMMRRAWVHYQLGDDAKATESFTNLYRDQPDKDIAEAMVFSLSRGGRWDRLARLAQSLGGPLTEVAEAAKLQRYYGGKMFLNAESAFPGNFAELDNIASTSVALGVMVRYKPGSDGTSQLRVLRVPAVEGVKVFDGVHELRLQMDLIDLSAGNLPAGAMIGSFPAAGVYVVTPTTQLSNSVEPYLSYRYQGTLTTYAGLGLTPSNGVIASAPIWNLGITRELGRGNLGAELFTQPVRETILSYTGIVDPYTGQSWGRVLRSGGLVRGYSALTDNWGVAGGLQVAYLQGVNVANNQSLKVNLSLSRNLTFPDSKLFPVFDYFTVGPNLSYESYRKNLGQFTFGQGGYYSPQRTVMFGVSSQFLTAEARQYMIRGGASVGRFTTRSAASPCFPLGAVLPLNPVCVTGFTASSGTGTSYSAEAVGVRRLSDHLQLGGGVIWRRSPQYDDKLGMVFLRYLFDPRPAVMSTDIPDSMFQRLY
jgi:tetratricopeptide (TPR) repeat protein